jgi:tRNA(fMet)-specific endonuclease VapC
MENEVILLDTSILIDYFRKKDKSNSVLLKLSKIHQQFAISTVTEYEIFTGTPDDQKDVWNNFFKDIIILPFDSKSALLAANINIDLKKVNKRIDVQDLFIAATAISNGFDCATLNKKHFERIPNLKLVNV